MTEEERESLYEQVKELPAHIQAELLTKAWAILESMPSQKTEIFFDLAALTNDQYLEGKLGE